MRCRRVGVDDQYLRVRHEVRWWDKPLVLLAGGDWSRHPRLALTARINIGDRRFRMCDVPNSV